MDKNTILGLVLMVVVVLLFSWWIAAYTRTIGGTASV